jgi:hypothetical protein
MRDLGCKGKSLNFNCQLIFARECTSRNEGNSIFYFFGGIFSTYGTEECPVNKHEIYQCLIDTIGRGEEIFIT